MDSWALEYWYWLIFGMILILFELFIPSFTAFWFGLGAIAVSIFALIFPTRSLNIQLLIWAAASTFFTFLWFRYLRPNMIKRTRTGMSKERILGESGDVIRPPIKGQPGVVRFSIPILGSDEWPFVSEEHLTTGDRVVVIDISEETLIVKKRK